MLSRWSLAGLLLLSFVASATSAEDRSLREFPLPNMGALELAVPRTWKESVRQPPQGLPPTISFSPASGNEFNIQITPLWAVRPGVVVPGKDEIRRQVAQAAEAAKVQSVETTIPLKEIAGTSGSGTYFSATDRAAMPGEFRYMTQGGIRVGEAALMFTVLTNDGSEPALKEALQMLRVARHVARKAP